MISRFIYIAFLAVSLTGCAGDGVKVRGATDDVFAVDDSYTPYEWNRTYHGPDRFFERRDQFIVEP